MHKIDPLAQGDLIEILAPAKAIEVEHVEFAKSWLEQQGFRVQVSKHCLDRHNYFSATAENRLDDFQKALDKPEVKAIWCARGGYGCVQLVDKIDWSAQISTPKWILGFSDVTVFHHRMNKLQLPSIHATMPLNFRNNSEEALATSLKALRCEEYKVHAPSHKMNQQGIGKGQLIGGNLSIIYSLLGTNDQYNFSGSILFIEDLAEQLYHIDRMMYALEKSGVLNQINGLLVGGMTDMKDTEHVFGQSLEEIILRHLEHKNIPVCFGFPAGHIDDNRALVFGTNSELIVDESGASLRVNKTSF